MSIYHQTDLVTLYQGDCLEVMPQLEARSFDAIICDLPYGTTKCEWDSVIPFEPLWEQYKRLIKPNGAIVLFGSQPFTSALVMSNLKWFKYEWIWKKNVPSGMATANKRPMKYHENILIFSGSQSTYNKQLIDRDWKTQKIEAKIIRRATPDGHGVNTELQAWKEFDGEKKNPSSVIDFDTNPRTLGTIHPTQKPIALLEYLIRTYTNEGDTILDNTAGSGTTLVAARNTNRRAVGIEMDEGYCRVAAGRLGRFEPSEFEVDKKAVEGQLGLFGAIA